MDNLELYLDNDNTGMEIGGNSSPHSALFYEDMDRGLLAVESMVNLHETMRLSDRPTPEHINLFNLAVEQAYAVIDLQAPKSLSLESLTLTPRLAKESLLEDAKDAIVAISSKLGHFIKQTVDHMQYQTVLFDTQRRALLDLKELLKSNSSSVSKEFTVSVNKYMMFGSHQVPKTFSEYKKEYIKTMDIMKGFLDACDKFQKDDFLQSFKVLVSLVSGYDKKYEELWSNLFEFVTSIQKATNAKPYHSTDVVRYRTENLLGMSRIEFKLPARNTYDDKFVDTKKKVQHNLGAAFKRTEKFELGVGEDKVVFKDADINSLVEMCDVSINVSESIRKLYGDINRFSDLGAVYVTVDYFAHAFFPITWWHFLLASYRLVVQTSFILLDNTASAFNFSRGNIDKFIRTTKKNISNT